MKLKIAAVGRMRSGPEAELISDYIKRFDRTGRALGLGPLEVVEVEAKKGGMAAEGELLSRAISGAGITCVLDERGKTLTSPDFANLLANWRDQGRGEIAFVIGSAGGIAANLRNQADYSLSFGKMVWPHMLARAMLSEQLYRAASILAGSPYHRE